jgi:pyridoxamine 5'-phosphate oxidase
MDLQDCISFANNYPSCSLATIDGDQARVRTFQLWFADETGFYFVTFSTKDVSRQLKANPKVELCFFNNPANFQGMRQLRVTGRADLVDDEALRARALRERTHLEQAVGEPLGPTLEVFRIGTGEARFWTVKDFLKEPQIESVQF